MKKMINELLDGKDVRDLLLKENMYNPRISKSNFDREAKDIILSDFAIYVYDREYDDLDASQMSQIDEWYYDLLKRYKVSYNDFLKEYKKYLQKYGYKDEDYRKYLYFGQYIFDKVIKYIRDYTKYMPVF